MIELTKDWMNDKVLGKEEVWKESNLTTLSKTGKPIVEPKDIRPIGV